MMVGRFLRHSLFRGTGAKLIEILMQISMQAVRADSAVEALNGLPPEETCLAGSASAP
jgi:hypothetical protein